MLNNFDFPEPIVFTQRTEMSFPVFQFDLSNEINISETVAKVKSLQTQFPCSTVTNVITETGWRSPYIYNCQPEVQMFDNEVTCIQQKLNQINSFQTKLINLWSVIYGNNDHTNVHNHFILWDKDKLAYNTILYLTDSNTPIVFETTESPIEIFPKKGMLVAMHPLTKHYVPLVSDQLERIVLVCNFAIS